MLQQTQVDRVLAKYLTWLDVFPDWQTLAHAPFRQVLQHWQGLGYNRRAQYLQQTARIIQKEYQGALPVERHPLLKLPGIGPYTAAAIRVFAFEQPDIVIETNIRTVYLHAFYPDEQHIHDQQLLPLIEQTLPKGNLREWYYALMDYGAMLKKAHPNPGRRSAHHTKQSAFIGSDRQVRGQILRLLTAKPLLSRKKIEQELHIDTDRLERILVRLTQDQLIARSKQRYTIYQG